MLMILKADLILSLKQDYSLIMANLKLKLNDRIEGWDHNDDESNPCSNNMLRVLQNKINNSIRFQQRQQLYNRKINVRSVNSHRPATVNVRMTSTNKQTTEELQTHQTIDLCQAYRNNINESQKKLEKNEKGHQQMKLKNKSVGMQMRNRIKNKENLLQKDFSSLNEKYKEKPRGEQLQVKKQQLIFNNFQSVKNKNSKQSIKKFHELEIKFRKNRLHTNQPLFKQNQKIHVLIQSYGKGAEIKISQVHIPPEKATEQNIIPLGLEKSLDGQYTKLSRKNKYIRQKQSIKKQSKKQTDLFADTHLADQSLHLKNIV